jgi:hypothetical protein
MHSSLEQWEHPVVSKCVLQSLMYSNSPPTANFKYPWFSICIHFCQSWYLILYIHGFIICGQTGNIRESFLLGLEHLKPVSSFQINKFRVSSNDTTYISTHFILLVSSEGAGNWHRLWQVSTPESVPLIPIPHK